MANTVVILSAGKHGGCAMKRFIIYYRELTVSGEKAQYY